MTINEEYVHLKVSIPKSVSTRFRELVNMKHPRFEKGVLSYEIEQAMRQCIATYTHIQNTKNTLQVEKSNPIPKVFSFKQDVFKWLIDSQLYLEVPQFILKKHLEMAIGALRGTDRRTINKWLNDLEKYGCLKKSGIQQYEFV